MEQALFFVFAALAVAAAINLLRESHPVYSALSLVVVMGSLAALYLLLGAEFIAAVQVIVYAGAIMVLFLFVIMLLNAETEARASRSRMASILGLPLVMLLVLQLISVLRASGELTARKPSVAPAAVDNTRLIGQLLFRDFLLPFEVTSVLILVAIMGAVVLARRKS